MGILKQLMTENAELKVENASLRKQLHMKDEETSYGAKRLSTNMNQLIKYLKAKGDH